MNDHIKQEILEMITPLQAYGKVSVLKLEEGSVELRIPVQDKMKNIYGRVHGGSLFAVCDLASGIIARTYGKQTVTQQANINYIKGIGSGDMFVEAKAIHAGRKTAVVNVTIKDEEDDQLVSATFTMFFLS